MPIAAKEMTARAVAALREPGRYAVGGAPGLTLTISDKDSRAGSWSMRYSFNGQRREIGLGKFPLLGLAEARNAARERLVEINRGVDPAAARTEARKATVQKEQARVAESTRKKRTLGTVARTYHEKYIEPNRSDKHAAQWLSSLENHIPPELWDKPVDAVTPQELLSVLTSIKPHERARNINSDARLWETVKRIRQRLDVIYDDAVFQGYCTGNPAAAIKERLPKAMGVTKASKKGGHFAALPYAMAPALMKRVREAAGTGARCLEFAMLTAARTGDVIDAPWSEFDLEARVWLIPAERMKAREDHTVYLSDAAVAVLRRQLGENETYVFPSNDPRNAGKGLSNAAMKAVLVRLGMHEATTVHGLCRTTFSTWANENEIAPPDAIEASLAHKEPDKVRASYNRAQYISKRRALMDQWAGYLAGNKITDAAALEMKKAGKAVSAQRKAKQLAAEHRAGA